MALSANWLITQRNTWYLRNSNCHVLPHAVTPDFKEVVTNEVRSPNGLKVTIIPSAYMEFRLLGEKYYPTLSTIDSQSSGLTQSFPPIFHLDSLGEWLFFEDFDMFRDVFNPRLRLGIKKRHSTCQNPLKKVIPQLIQVENGGKRLSRTRGMRIYDFQGGK